MIFCEMFNKFSKTVSRWTGHPFAFLLAVLVVIVWAVTGPLFRYSDTWQLVINTGTTIITFLMVFLIQNTQNRDAAAMQIKLDELIRARQGAHNAMLGLEELSEQELEEFHARYLKYAEDARQALEEGQADTNCEEIAEEWEDDKS